MEILMRLSALVIHCAACSSSGGSNPDNPAETDLETSFFDPTDVDEVDFVSEESDDDL
jgi:hypothetical protein